MADAIGKPNVSRTMAKPTSDKAQTPDGWKVARLGGVAILRKKQVTPDGSDARPYVALENIASGGALNGYGKAADSISNKTEFHKGDTLFGKLRPNLRKVVRADFDGVCSTDILAIASNGQADGHFLSHLLRSDTLHRHAMRGIAGTKMPRTSWSHLQAFSFDCPPLAEQRAIAAVLDSIDEAIERTEAVVAATERLRDALLHELLTRGVPGWHTEWKDVAGVGTMPAGWEVARLGDVAEINHSNWNPASSTTILYLDLTSVTEPGVLAPPKSLASTEAPSRARRRIKSGDILISTVRPNLRGFARVLQAPKDLVASTGFAVVSPRQNVNGSFIYHQIMGRRFAQYLENAPLVKHIRQCSPAMSADSSYPSRRLPSSALSPPCWMGWMMRLHRDEKS